MQHREKVLWNISKVFNGPNGIGYCFFSCQEEAIADFGCGSNNITAYYNQMKNYVDELKNIKGASEIKESDKACYGSKTCSAFT
ncbi:hypothetical protein CHUAL_005129 [Chamberlinius hualienensis]